MKRQSLALSLLLAACLAASAQTQAETAAPLPATSPETPISLTPRERLLLERVEQLERRLEALEKQMGAVTIASVAEKPAPTLAAAPNPPVAQVAPPVTPALTQEDRATLDFFRDVTINFAIDGNYGYNFNRPFNRVNLLRAYDVSSNSFSLSQASIVIEKTPQPEKGERFGFRLDLQHGQATETVQGNAANELRPQTFRPIWQAYGTYVAPIGKGLTVDFGKWASSLGYETNYTKDNFNYSRSYFFNFLPFYHFGLRAKYPVNDKVTLLYNLVNGVQQSEDFNGFKSQQFAVALTPNKKISTQFNYYAGREQRDTGPNLNPTFSPFASQPGLPTDAIRPVPRGRLHILDAYATFTPTDKLTLAVEGDYVVNRVESNGPPVRVAGGAGYARYQFTPKFVLAGRAEYLSDRGGLFSGQTQALKEGTFTAEYKFADGFLLRGEFRRDWSNRPFFFTERPGVFKKEQNTATLGFIWWLGRKQGAW